jgi:hypothetical protein
LHGYRIFFEQLGDHSRVQISANAHDPLGLEKDDPTVTIVESHTVLRRRQGVKLHGCLLAFDDEVFEVKLSSFRKHLAQFGEGAGNKRGLAVVAPCERVTTHHDPIDVVSDVRKEGSSVTVLQTFKYFTNIGGCNGPLTSPRSLPVPGCFLGKWLSCFEISYEMLSLGGLPEAGAEFGVREFD